MYTGNHKLHREIHIGSFVSKGDLDTGEAMYLEWNDMPKELQEGYIRIQLGLEELLRECNILEKQYIPTLHFRNL